MGENEPGMSLATTAVPKIPAARASSSSGSGSSAVVSGENPQSMSSVTPASSANGRRPEVYMRVAATMR